MLLQEKMKQNIFSYNEQTIIHFILEKQRTNQKLFYKNDW